MKVRIEIDTKTFIRFWLVVIAFAFVILAIYSVRTALILIGISLFLALALNAPVSYLAGYLPGKSRVAGTALAYILVVIILGAFVFFIVPPVIQQTLKFANTVPDIVNHATTQWQGLNKFIEHYHLELQVNSALDSIKNSTNRWVGNVGSDVISGLGSLIQTIASIVIVLVLTFLMLVEGPTWLNRLWETYNDEDRMEYHRNLVHRMYHVVTGYVTGQLAVSAIGAFLAGATVFVLSFFFPRVPSNLALPTVAIAFTFSLIPMFGATLSGILISILLAFNDLSSGIIFAFFFILYQQIENNFVSPTIQSRKLELSPLSVLVAVTIGLDLFGLAGGIISIPIAGCLKVLLEDYLRQAKKNRVKSERPLARLVKKMQGDEGPAA